MVGIDNNDSIIRLLNESVEAFLMQYSDTNFIF